MSKLTDWVTEVTGDASWRAIATATGTTHATIQRRLEHEPGAAVLEIARAYGANPLGGWVAAGLITREEVIEWAETAKLEDVGDVALAREVLRRAEKSDANNNTGPHHKGESPCCSV